MAINPGGTRVAFSWAWMYRSMRPPFASSMIAGDIVKEGKAEADPQAIVTWLGAVSVAIERLGLEGGPLSPRLHEALQIGLDPTVLSPAARSISGRFSGGSGAWDKPSFNIKSGGARARAVVGLDPRN